MKNFLILLMMIVGFAACTADPPEQTQKEVAFDVSENLYASLGSYQEPASTTPAPEVKTGIIEKPNWFNLLKDNWAALLFALMALLKIIVNITPTEKDNKIFSRLDNFINAIFPDKMKGGGKHSA